MYRKNIKKSFTHPTDKQFDKDIIKRLFSDSEHIIRAKGHLNIGKMWILFNAVMGKFNYQRVTKKDKNTIVLISTKNIDLPYS
ncbi:GTP-binding protein [Labilibacter sediminis]|nr:GTP-binding protein [Labilibacter sediminis]